jgi:thioredoxin 2
MTPDSVILRCKQCGAKNRVPKQRLNDRPICGKCRAPLPPDPIFDQPVVVTDQTFQQEVLDFSGPVLLDCWAPWCGPCQMVAPLLIQLAKEFAGRAKIAKLNVDQNPITAGRYHVMSIPTILLFKNGQLVNSIAGALSKNEMDRHLRGLV